VLATYTNSSTSLTSTLSSSSSSTSHSGSNSLSSSSHTGSSSLSSSSHSGSSSLSSSSSVNPLLASRPVVSQCSTPCGYSFITDTYTYPGPGSTAEEPYTHVTQTIVTFTYINADNSTSLSVGTFTNYVANATEGEAFTTPPVSAPPQLWSIYGITM